MALHPTAKEANIVGFFFFIPVNFPFLASGWLSLLSLDRMQLPIAFQQSLIEHACVVFFSQHCHTVSYTLLQGKEHPGGRARRGFSVEIQHMWLRALKQNNKPFPPAACGLLLGSWVIKLRNFQPVGNQSLP